MSDFKKSEAQFHKMHDADGRLYEIKSFISPSGVKVYYMSRPKPVNSTESPVCSVHVYEQSTGFLFDLKRCKFCNKEELK